jgi:hypothetical protein
VTTVHGGVPARRTLALLTTLILTAAGLAIGAPAHATPVDPDNPYRLPTFIDCARGTNKGRMHVVVPAGPGKVWVFGSVRACRSPKPTDTVLITDVDHELARPADGPSHVYFHRTTRGFFGRVVTLSATTRRLCLSDTPDGALDCYSVRVPSRNGQLGVPVVHGRTTTRNVKLDSYYGFCGSCW